MKIAVEHQDGVALITLDDGKKNAINLAALEDLANALDEAESADAIVIAGRPGSFCAGFDIETMRSDDVNTQRALGLGGGRLALRLFAHPKPVVAACTGHAFTVGAFWLLACDTRIGERGEFKFAMTETAMGMVMPAWGNALLELRIAPTHFVQVVTQSKIYDPEGAVTAGFLDELVPAGTSIDTAMDTAAKLAQLPSRAYEGNKLAVRKPAIAAMQADLA